MIEAAIAELPAHVLRVPRRQLLLRLDYAERLIARGQTATTLLELRYRRRRLDGCQPLRAGAGDWIKDCPAQIGIRVLVDRLIANLSCASP